MTITINGTTQGPYGGTDTTSPYTLRYIYWNAAWSGSGVNLAYMACKPYSTSITWPSGSNGFDEIVNGTNGTVANGLDVGSQHLQVSYKVRESEAGGTGLAYPFDGPSNPVVWGNFYIEKDSSQDWVIDACKGSDLDTSTDTLDVTGDATLALGAGDMLIVIVPGPSNGVGFSGDPTITVPGCTLSAVTTVEDWSTGSGYDARMSIYAVTVTAGAATGAPRIVNTVNSGTAFNNSTSIVAFVSLNEGTTGSIVTDVIADTASMSQEHVADASATTTFTEFILPYRSLDTTDEDVHAATAVAIMDPSLIASTPSDVHSASADMALDSSLDGTGADTWAATATADSGLPLPLSTSVHQASTPTVTLYLGPQVPTPALDVNERQTFTPPVALLLGTSVHGDDFADPYLATPLAGIDETQSGQVANIPLSTMTIEANEPDADGPNDDATAWLWFKLDVPGNLTVDCTDTTAEITFWQGTSLEDLESVESVNLAPGSEWAELAADEFYVRIMRLTSGATTADVDWTFQSTPAPYVLEVNTPVVYETPTSIVVSVLNLPENEPVDFYVGGALATTLTSDDTGRILFASIPTGAIAAGEHPVVVSAGGYSTDQLFTVLIGPPSRPTSVAADAPPVAIGDGVSWVFQDLQPSGLGSYVLPFNPERWSSPRAPKKITAAQTVSPDGQPIVWMGGTQGTAWSFSGKARTATFVQKLREYGALNRRFYLIDHRNQAWIVTFDDVNLQPYNDVDYPDAHNYEVRAWCYAGPVEVP